MWPSEDEEQADGWRTTYGSSTEGCWTKSPSRGSDNERRPRWRCKSRCSRRRVLGEFDARAGTPAQQSKRVEGARVRGAVPSSFATAETNEQLKDNEKKKTARDRDPRTREQKSSANSRQKSELSQADFERDELHRALKSALETQVIVCSVGWLSVFSDYVGRLGNEPLGARARVALTGTTVAEYFRDAEETETKAAAAVASNAKSRAAFESQRRRCQLWCSSRRIRLSPMTLPSRRRNARGWRGLFRESCCSALAKFQGVVTERPRVKRPCRRWCLPYCPTGWSTVKSMCQKR